VILCEDIIPFPKEVEKRAVTNVPIDPIRRRREQLKDKLEIQRRNVNVHLQRVESGIDNIIDGTYYIKTNHLPRYAATSAMEILLRGYLVLMGQLDPEDPMVDFDCSNLRMAAQKHIERVRSLLKSYADRRSSLVSA
jgi:hypothetical protein